MTIFTTLKSPIGVGIGWASFAGTHLLLSHEPIRTSIIEKIGKDSFLGMYSMVSFATLLPTCYIYGRYGARKGRMFWKGDSLLSKGLGNGLKLTGLYTFGQSIVTPSKTAMKDQSKEGSDEKEDFEPKGFERITRHGLFLSFALLGLGNVITRGHAGDILFWGSFPAFWLVGSAHQDVRKRKELPEEYFEKTSLLPFQAILEGRNSLTEAQKEMNGHITALVMLSPLFMWT